MKLKRAWELTDWTVNRLDRNSTEVKLSPLFQKQVDYDSDWPMFYWKQDGHAGY